MATKIARGRARASHAAQRRRTTLRQLLRPADFACIAVLFWMSGPVAPFIPNLDNTLSTMFLLHVNTAPPPVDASQDLLRLSWIPVFLIVLALAFRDARAVTRSLLDNRVLVLLIAWTMLSTLWSVSPEDTVRRGIALAASTLFGISLGSRFEPIELVRLVAVALTIAVAASLLCGIVFPEIGVASEGDYAGAWRGVFTSKNSLGAMMLLACLAYYVLYTAEGSRRYLLAIAAALMLLLLSQSRTPLVILAALVPLLALVHRYFRNSRRFGFILGLAVCTTGLVMLFAGIVLGPLLALTGRDMTLTGRTDIWALSWEAIQSRFWAGYGYGAFWSNPWGPATEIWDALNWRVPSSHSGVLELWLGLGFVGVALFAALLLRTFRRVTLELASNRREEALWRVGFFFIFVVHAATEPSIMEQTSISWVLFVALGIAPRVVSALPVTKKRARRPAPWSQRLPAERSSAPSAQQPISSFDRPWRRPWRGTSG